MTQKDSAGRGLYEVDGVHYDFEYVEGDVQPRNDNVLIRWEEIPETTESGLVALPRNDYARAIDGRAAIVVAAGPGPSYSAKCGECGKAKNPYPMGVKPGDRVIVDGRQVGEVIFVDGVEHRLVREAELLAVVES
jgi:co-chaperonin GroES (HSP10)